MCKEYTIKADIVRELKKAGKVWVHTVLCADMPVEKAEAIEHAKNNPCVLRVWEDGYKRLDPQ